jgi:hypothetical protein
MLMNIFVACRHPRSYKLYIGGRTAWVLHRPLCLFAVEALCLSVALWGTYCQDRAKGNESFLLYLNYLI